MPKKGKKEGGLPSDFYLKLQRPKVFDRELKRWVEKAADGEDWVEHNSQGNQIWLDKSKASYESSLLSRVGGKGDAATAAEAHRDGAEEHLPKPTKKMVIDAEGKTMDVEIVSRPPRLQRRTGKAFMSEADALRGTPKRIDPDAPVWQRSAGAKGYMYVARPSPRPSAVEMMSQAPEKAKRRAETGGGINIKNVPIYHSLQASVPSVPRHRSNPGLFDARTLFNKSRRTPFASPERMPMSPTAVPAMI